MSTDDKDEGGVVLGGISFGTHPGTKSGAAGAVELGDALLPLRLVAVADLSPRPDHNAGAGPPEGAVRVESGDVESLAARIAPRVAIEVDSVLDPERKARVDLSVTSTKSFRPDSLVREVPLLRSLLDGKRVLKQLRDGTIDVEAARSELGRLWDGAPLVSRVIGGVELRKPAEAQAPAPDEDASDDDVDRILDMVGEGDGSTDAAPKPAAPKAPAPPKKEGRFDAFLATIAGAGKRGGAKPAEAVRILEKAIGVQLGAILQHEEVRRLEEAWRGIELLVQRAPKTGVSLEVVSARPDDMATALDRAITAGAGIEPPVSVAVVDDAFGGSAADLARLRAIAEVGEGHAVPVLTSATPSLFDHEDLSAIDRLDDKQALFDAPERVAWRSEAHRPAMLWVGLSLNRVLARSAYDARSSRIREAQIAELPDDEASAAVWIRPAHLLAGLVMQSFDKTGWPCRITGARDGGTLENLTVREVETPGSAERIAIPTEAFFSTETQTALSRIGLIALAAQPNSDAIYLLTAPTAYVPPPKRTQDGDTTEPAPRPPRTPLVDQLFVARFAQFLRAVGSRIAPTEAPEDVRKFLEAASWELFDVAKPGSIELDIDVQEAGDGLQASVTIRPRRFLGVSMEEITLGVPLG